jgi:hypothetical protein
LAELLGAGLTHYPPLLGMDEDMGWVLKWTLEDPDIPDALKRPHAWPEPMQEEWGRDGGTSAAKLHRQALLAGLDRVRDALERFAPDVIVMFGDDQYENFKEDIVPPYAVLAYEDMDITPWTSMKRRVGTNYWGEPDDTVRHVAGAADIGRYLVTELMRRDFDAAYAYRPLHQAGLPHSFLNAILLLDHERRGFEHKVLPVAVNCYGKGVISRGGSLSRFADVRETDPPSPSPGRCMQLGAAIGEIMAASPWRTALLASSSWSHAFLTDHTWRLHPDHDADRALYRAFTEGDFEYWRARTTEDIEAAGQQEVLNWFCLAGAMSHFGLRPAWSEFIPTWVFNSNKVFALFPEVPVSPGRAAEPIALGTPDGL